MICTSSLLGGQLPLLIVQRNTLAPAPRPVTPLAGLEGAQGIEGKLANVARAHERVVLRERIRATFAAKRARGERIGTATGAE